MSVSKYTEATLLYDVNGRQQSKKIKLPAQRIGLGILKQREGYVIISYWKTDPDVAIHAGSAAVRKSFVEKVVNIPSNAGQARLKVGNRVISVAD